MAVPWVTLVAASFATKFLRTIFAAASVGCAPTPESIRPTVVPALQARADSPMGAPIIAAA